MAKSANSERTEPGGSSADWIDVADLKQWSLAESEHQRLWQGWQKFLDKENAQQPASGEASDLKESDSEGTELK